MFSWAAVEHANYYEVSVYCTDGNSQRQYIGDFDHKRYTSPETIKIDGLVPLTDYVVAVSAGLGSYMSEERMLQCRLSIWPSPSASLQA